jgi:hypothetical protein
MSQNVYSVPREAREGEEARENKPKRFEKTYQNKREYEDSHKNEGPELDSDGFEIVGTEKQSTTKRPRREYHDGPRKHFNRDGDGKFNKYKKNNEESKEGEEKPEQEAKKVVKEEKPVILVYFNIIPRKLQMRRT